MCLLNHLLLDPLENLSSERLNSDNNNFVLRALPCIPKVVVSLMKLSALKNFKTTFRKYVPLNSMTLSARKPSIKKDDEDKTDTTDNSSSESKSNEGATKTPWWQSLPSNKKNKNKVILEEYDKLKSSVPDWPWMAALRKGSANAKNPLTRTQAKDTVRVVMSSTAASTPAESATAETTEKPIKEMKEEMAEADTIMPESKILLLVI